MIVIMAGLPYHTLHTPNAIVACRYCFSWLIGRLIGPGWVSDWSDWVWLYLYVKSKVEHYLYLHASGAAIAHIYAEGTHGAVINYHPR